MIKYSGNMWGEPHPYDLSRCESYEEFIHKINIVNAKIYNSLRNGGRHACLIGDMRKAGKYYSIQKDMNWYGDLESHIIKIQHNFQSQTKEYNGSFIPIFHEHLLIFRKNQIWKIPIQITKTAVKNLFDSTLATWRDLVQAALEHLNGKAKLHEIYELLKNTEKAKNNKHFEAKIRQTLQQHKEFSNIERGCWALSF